MGLLNLIESLELSWNSRNQSPHPSIMYIMSGAHQNQDKKSSIRPLIGKRCESFVQKNERRNKRKEGFA